MNNRAGHARESRQFGRSVEVRHNWHGACLTQLGAARGLAGDSEYAIAITQQRQQTHPDIAAAYDEQAGLANFGHVRQTPRHTHIL
jgi:hypothetical protein